MNILIVSPSFAPYSGVGSVRMISLSKYLVDKGHRVIVLKTSPELWPADSLKSKIPDKVETIDVYANGDFDKCMEEYRKVVEKVLVNNRIDISIYSCNPYFIAPVAMIMKKKYNAKYIIEFRDLWIKDEFVTRNLLKRIKKVMVRFPYRNKEKMVIQHADAVVTVTPSDTKTLMKDYPREKQKIFTIFNGYDENRIIEIDEQLVSFKFQYIAIFGKFGYYDYRFVVEMLNAIKILWEADIKIKILHIGAHDKKTDKALAKTNFPKEAYINTGILDYAHGVKILEGAFACCLIVNYKKALGTKLFDYIYANKPIIYFAHKNSAIATILNTCKNTFRCNRASDVIKAINVINDKLIDHLGCDDKEQYSRNIQNIRYEELINMVVNNYETN